MADSLQDITEGRTRLLVPKKALTEAVPPKRPAFFNPKARLTRDVSLAAYGAFAKSFPGSVSFLDGLAGTGARGLRVANELNVGRVLVNDLNPSAIQIAKDSAALNGITDVEFSGDEACRFFSRNSIAGERGSIVDIDPFGSPVSFLDCGLRATIHGGILSCTATDLQVLNGLFQDACRRKYGGVPIRTVYGNETALRLVLGCLGTVAGRLNMSISPLYAESDMHYYRVYVRVLNKSARQNMGFIIHCNACRHREVSSDSCLHCSMCGAKTILAGPLWIGRLFEGEFVNDMASMLPELTVGKECRGILAKAVLESEIPGVYYTLDEIAAAVKSSPPRLDRLVDALQKIGHTASPTSLNPTGFRTSAGADEIKKIFLDYPV